MFLIVNLGTGGAEYPPVAFGRVSNSRPNRTADSAGHRNKVGEPLGWFHESEGLARTVVEARRDPHQVVRAEGREVSALGQVLAEQPVGVLVRPALPGAVVKYLEIADGSLAGHH